MTLEGFLLAILPSLCVSAVMAVFNARQKKREKETDARADARKRESLLGLKLTMATAKMSFAVAMAVKRGHANGEVEDAMKDYEAARKEYLQFLNEQAADHLTV